jgi:carbon storage regulator
MLVLSRRKGERILIGNSVILTVVECKGGRVRLGFHAPQTIGILREEISNDFQEPSPLKVGSETRRPINKG